MKVRGITKSFGFYVGDHTRPMVERLVDASGNLSDEIWSIPIDAAAIRDAGVRCETCEHYYQVGKDNDIGECGADWRDTGSGGESTKPHFFCHNHTLLTQPSEGKE